MSNDRLFKIFVVTFLVITTVFVIICIGCVWDIITNDVMKKTYMTWLILNCLLVLLFLISVGVD